NPSTGQDLGTYETLTAADLRAVIRRARAAQSGWAARPLAERARYVEAARRWLVANADALAETISACSGKTRLEALATEILASAGAVHWYQRHARRLLRPARLPNGSVLFLNKRSSLHRQPWGVIGIIAPWNYSLGIPMHEIVPALLAGNTVVFKTAPETLPVGERIAEMFEAAGLPPDVFHHVIVDGPLAGATFLAEGGVDKLFFTGSVRVGKLLMEQASRTLTPVSLELGGKDAMIVRADADLERAVNGAIWGGVSNAGQSCAGVERIYVHESVYEPFVEGLAAGVRRLRVGPSAASDTDVGAICTTRQMETIRRQVDEALALGARIKARAELPEGIGPQYFAPTVLVDVDHNMRVMREETFGPVLGVMKVADDEEALRLANDSPYGLTASIWSRDHAAARRIANRVRAGAVTINDHLMSHGLTETPWGGFKESGIGRGHGVFAFEEVTAPQVVIDDWLGFAARNLFWHPYSQSVYDALKGALIGLYGTGPVRRLRGLLRLAGALPRMFRRS
ncbi:MAG: aldehyde dehydrogenase family protein, partial [Gammaproteobacteria bacterium]